MIDQFLDMLKEDLIHWDFSKEHQDDNGKVRVYEKKNREGKPISASESYYRCSILIKDVSPE